VKASLLRLACSEGAPFSAKKQGTVTGRQLAGVGNENGSDIQPGRYGVCGVLQSAACCVCVCVL
jgi:hypothetical protein